MPELPEVQTVVDCIAPDLISRKINSCKIYQGYDRPLCGRSIRSLRAKLKNNLIQDVSRRGKYIVLSLERGFLTMHLRMTGQIIFADKTPKYTTFSLLFAGNHMHFVDVRKFGTIVYSDDLDYLEEKLGVEPLSASFNKKFFRDLLGKKSTKLKALLLDQKYIAGLGNIYVDEALWLAGLHPEMPANTVSAKKADLLLVGIKKILRTSIRHHGTTFISFQFDGAKTGSFKNKLNVFNRTGQECKNCRELIVKLKVAGRGTHICPTCQPEVS